MAMEKALKKQKVMLKILFFSEIWDRLSYYGIQAILVLYLTKFFHFNDAQAYTFYGIYAALAFSLPIIGGHIADQFIGYGRAIPAGLLLASAGNILLAQHSHDFSYLGIALFLIGIGLFKANNAGLLSASYEANDPKRESSFVIFYMAMNLGAILGPVIFGLLTIHYHCRYGFVLNAVGLMVTFAIFTLNYRTMIAQIKQPALSAMKIACFLLGVSVFTVTIILLFTFSNYFSWVMWPFAILLLGFLIYQSYKFETTEQYKLFSLIILIIFALFFFACSLQVSSSLALFIDRFVNRNVLGFSIPTASFASLEPFFVIMTSFIFIPLWKKRTRYNNNKFIITRILAGITLAALSFFTFSYIAHLANANNLHYIALLGIVLGNLLLGIGELCIGPALIAAVSYLAPKSLQGTFMGFWYFSIAFSGYIASLMARLNITEHITSALTFSHNFFIVGCVTLGISLVFLIIAPWLYRLMKPT